MTVELTEDMVGKNVVTEGGQQVGTVTEIEGEQFYVNYSGTEMKKERQQEVHVEDIDEITDETIIVVQST